jgi:Asp-tRNA(Asn)/Glu-tRNA(Gln) amidotransferase A subunit family amidase
MAALVPRVSATAVMRLEAAGAVLIGKTNTPEFALDIDTDNALFGPTLNPRDARLTPGGSSGGESAALAAGFSALGLGTDFGASIRWPAQCTGVTGLRPTAGAVPSSGALPWFTADALLAPQPGSFLAATQVVAPMARRVADLELALRVIAGPDGIDATVRGTVTWQRRATTPLRCAWFGEEGTYPVRADVRAAVAEAAEALAAAGLSVVRRRPDAITAAEAVYDRLRAADDSAWMLMLPVDGGGSRPPMVQAAIEASRRCSPADRARDLETRAELRASLLAFLDQHQILLCPVSSVPAFPAGATELHVAGEAVPRMGIVACCRAVGLFGLPAVSVPYATAADGAVISVQVVGRPFADFEVLAVAALLEHGP